MRHITACALFGAALLLGALPAWAEEPLAKPPALTAPAPVPPDTRDSYIRNAESELTVWKHDVDDFATRAQTSGREAAKATAKQLGTAWDKAKAEGDKLASSTAEGWDRTKSSFEAAAHAFSDRFNQAKTDSASTQ